MATPKQIADLTAWVRSSCTVVPPETWQASAADQTDQPAAGQGRGGPGNRGLGSQQLYDCAPEQS